MQKNLIGFNDSNQYSDLVNHINIIITATPVDHYGVIIGCQRSVGLLVKSNGMTAIIDSHMHMSNSSGAMIIMADSPKVAINHYAKLLADENQTSNIGTLTWVKYSL